MVIITESLHTGPAKILPKNVSYRARNLGSENPENP